MRSPWRAWHDLTYNPKLSLAAVRRNREYGARAWGRDRLLAYSHYPGEYKAQHGAWCMQALRNFTCYSYYMQWKVDSFFLNLNRVKENWTSTQSFLNRKFSSQICPGSQLPYFKWKNQGNFSPVLPCGPLGFQLGLLLLPSQRGETQHLASWQWPQGQGFLLSLRYTAGLSGSQLGMLLMATFAPSLWTARGILIQPN